ncbi:hypothetical protein D026_1261C, partial [Vibrio parahaemolyticus 605]
RFNDYWLCSRWRCFY